MPSPLVRSDPPGVAVFTHAETVQPPLFPRFTIGLLMLTDVPLARLTALPKRPPATIAAPLTSVPFIDEPPVPLFTTVLPMTESNV